MSDGKHLTLSDRTSIEASLKEGISFKGIASELGKDPSTISKEVRAHITIIIPVFSERSANTTVIFARSAPINGGTIVTVARAVIPTALIM